MYRNDNEINLFVPGRICLVGELSDWAIEYKNQNKDIIPGRSIATGIDKGIYATIKRYNCLKFHMGEYDFECEMEEDILEKEATSKSFYSYICGITLHMIRKYNVSGIFINIKYNTLPIKKGLSSSAAICVIIAKAFNEIYHLNLSDNELMQDAYYGEHLALSQCGRLDQIIVKGNTQLSKMVFYENCVSITPISVRNEINLVIADLKGNKDTRKILNALRSCYPFAKNKEQEAVHHMLGDENKVLVDRMYTAIESGDIEEIGKIFNESQALIDKAGIPICDEYKAPLLHEVINNSTIKKLSYGVRGIGSGGDGSVQIIARDRKSQLELVAYLNNELKMDAFKYDIKATHKIRKAIIPVAGFATRLYPVSRAIKKAFMPINDEGIMKPIILKLVEELDKAGIEEICLVIGSDDKETFDTFFKKSLNEDHLKKFDKQTRDYEFNILRIGEKIKYVIQDEQKGFGHAIYLCKEFAGSDPTLMLLGDTYYTSNTEKTCIEQMLEYYDEVERNIIAVGEIPDDEIQNVGIMTGLWEDNQRTKMSVKKLVEKPSVEYAHEHLQMDNNKCYGNFGMWIINHHVFNQIGENIKNRITSKGEYQFVDAIAQILGDVEVKALKIDGTSYDVGNLKSYQKTLISTILEKNTEIKNIEKLQDLEVLRKIKELLDSSSSDEGGRLTPPKN